MQGSNVYFNPEPTTFYKVVSVMDGNKTLTISPQQKLVLGDYTGVDNQKFHVYLNNGKYAFVSPNNSALFVVDDDPKNGALVKSDPGQHKSSFFEITPVPTGQWAGKSCYIKTVNGKALDISGCNPVVGATVHQWELHGGNNQCWVITPAVGSQQPVQPNQPIQPVQPVQPNQPQQAQVPAQFTPDTNTDYRIVSAMNASKALTVGNQGKLTISDFKGDATQKFKIFQNGTKFAFVVQSNNSGLCVFQDSKDNQGAVLADPGQHPSSWFEIVRNSTQGQWLNKGYLIKTHAGNRVLDISGANLTNGTAVFQYDQHNGGNQTWIIVPASQPLQQPIQPPKQPQVNPLIPGFLPNVTNLNSVITQWGQPSNVPTQPQWGQVPNVPIVPNIPQWGQTPNLPNIPIVPNVPTQPQWGQTPNNPNQPQWGQQSSHFQTAQGWGKPGWGQGSGSGNKW